MNNLKSGIKLIAFILIFLEQLVAQQTPFSGSPIEIPGKIEAENFDNGGEGIAYHDTDIGNNGGAYRDTDVDIEDSSEGTPNIGWIQPNEWLEYTVNVLGAGLYTIEVRVAAELDSGNFHIEFDEIDVTGLKSFNSTEGWQTWTTVSIPDVELFQGEQIIRFYCELFHYL